MTQLNDFARQWQDIEADAIAAFTETGQSGWYILGREVSLPVHPYLTNQEVSMVIDSINDWLA